MKLLSTQAMETLVIKLFNAKIDQNANIGHPMDSQIPTNPWGGRCSQCHETSLSQSNFGINVPEIAFRWESMHALPVTWMRCHIGCKILLLAATVFDTERIRSGPLKFHIADKTERLAELRHHSFCKRCQRCDASPNRRFGSRSRMNGNHGQSYDHHDDHRSTFF